MVKRMSIRFIGVYFAALILLFTNNLIMAADTSQGIFNSSFRTLKVEKEGSFMSPPVIRLGSGERIVVSFDEIGDDWSRLQFRLIHCNADWQPSRLIESEYIDGFNFCDIEDYAFSGNTFTNFTNYRFTIPSPNMGILASGNYVAEVYPIDNPDDIILRARFQVSEDAVVTEGKVTPRTDKGFNSEWQQVELAVTSPSKNINPYNDIIISVMQNRRPDTEVFITHPSRADNGKYIYEHLWELIFPASNEYRRFETVKEDYPGMGIESVGFENRSYQAWLNVDTDREEKEYSYDQTQFGRFMIDSYNATDADLGADYVDVHFTLDYPQLMNGEIYVNGDFTSNRYDDKYKMIYDPETHMYHLTLPLKQGSYNYQYVAVKDGDKIGQTGLIEGNKYETRNEYTISVYYRSPVARADRLIGRATVVSY